MNAKKKTAVIALAAVFACGTLAGCDALTVRNLTEDYARTVATVNIATSDAFKKDGEFEDLKDVADQLVGTAEISKRDLVLSFLSNGSTLVQSYGMSVEQAFDYLLDNLIQREAYVQYAKAYLLKNGSPNKDEVYTVEGYKAAVGAVASTASDAQKEAASLGYFLTKAEKDKALYDLRVAINNAIDSQEEGLIEAAEDEHDHTADSDVRTTPTGADTVKDDFYDNNYAIYTGKETALGTYEKLDGSTVATRKAAYNLFISNLYSGNQLKKGEDTSKIEGTEYFADQLVSQYGSALINKMSDKFEQDAIARLNKAIDEDGNTWADNVYKDALKNQEVRFGKDRTKFEDAFNNVSNSSFVFTAPQTDGSYDAYGYVLNILLPFSSLQTEELNSYKGDFGDVKEAKYAARARLLEKLKATDQRGTWFTGHEDYSYEADEYFGKDQTGRSNYLFFENSSAKSEDEKDSAGNVVKSAQYEKIANYLGKYSYNGTITRDDDGDVEKVTPSRITINDFLAEMEGYMTSDFAKAALDADHQTADLSITKSSADNDNFLDHTSLTDYYTRENFYTDDNKVDYAQFLYEVGQVNAFKNHNYDPNNIFVEGTPENVAFSVINELSFAYNTDTAGLNSYLGYMISPYKTSFMKEFEYASQLVVRIGAGSYAVVPTDYGWHIIYCTFSFTDVEDGKAAFTFDRTQVENGENEKENSFSWNFFDQLKSQVVQDEVSSRQSDILAKYTEACSEKFEYVYSDLLSL